MTSLPGLRGARTGKSRVGSKPNAVRCSPAGRDTPWASWALGVLGLGLGLELSAPGFVGELNANGQPRKWALNPTDFRVPATSVNAATRAIVYRLDSAGSGTGDAAAELNAIRSAFDQWQGIPGTVLKFEEGAPLSGTTDVNPADGRNVLFWARSGFVNGGRDNLSGVLALTYVSSYSDNNVITDVDVVFNGAEYKWFTDHSNPTLSDIFVEGIALHEIGHALGLVHSPVGGATMLFVGERGVNSQVGLSEDERIAARALYGTTATLDATGRVTGSVKLGTDPVGGAAVFVQDAAGTLLSGTVTRTNGVYELPGLPPGSYAIRAVPLDPSIGANYLVRGMDIWSTYRNSLTQFHPSADQVVTISGRGTATADFAMTSGNPVRVVRVLRPAPDLASPSYNNKPVTVLRGGPAQYVGVLIGSTLIGTEQLAVTGDGLTLGAPERRANALGALTLVAAPLLVASNATPGLRSLRLQRGNSVAWAHGFLEIADPVPDVNLDGLDDRFQRRYWPRWTVAASAPAADPDGDGFDNRWEAASGSDPTNRLSAHFDIESVQVTTAGARVRSQAAAGKRFRLFSRDTVPGADWLGVGAPVTALTNGVEFLDTSATNQVRYYRVQLVP